MNSTACTDDATGTSRSLRRSDFKAVAMNFKSKSTTKA